MISKTRLVNLLQVLFCAVASFLPTSLLCQEPFYQGKTISMIVGTEAGGTGELRARSFANQLSRYIPGKPTIFLQFMGGGGGQKAANHMYHVARPDGLTIGVIGSGLVANSILGASGVRFDLDKFIFLGSSISRFQRVFTTRKELGLSSLEKLKAYRRLRIGGMSIGSEIYILGRLFTYLLGLEEPVFVPGYGGSELDLAVERGEVDARGNTVGTIMVRSPQWIEKSLMDFHATIEVPRGYNDYPHPLFKALPEMESFAASEKERRLLALYRAMRGVGSPYVLPPATPQRQADILRDAFRKTFQDREFQSDFKKFTVEDASPLMPEEQEKIIRELPRNPEVIELFNIIAGPKPLPKRG
jgi:tripartite-type tricarboxylate transporter receptor subunit TctC